MATFSTCQNQHFSLTKTMFALRSKFALETFAFKGLTSNHNIYVGEPIMMAESLRQDDLDPSGTEVFSVLIYSHANSFSGTLIKCH